MIQKNIGTKKLHLKKNKLKNCIEEINLNLDELDSDGELESNEINLQAIGNNAKTNTNTNTNTNEIKEIKNDKSTKYIFFNDAK